MYVLPQIKIAKIQHNILSKILDIYLIDITQVVLNIGLSYHIGILNYWTLLYFANQNTFKTELFLYICHYKIIICKNPCE